MAWWDPFSWFGDAQHAAEDWLSSSAGSIASGFEGAFIAVFKDLWNVIEGGFYILIGAILALAALFLLLRGDEHAAQIASAVVMK